MVSVVELLELSAVRLVRDGFRAMKPLELVMTFSNSTVKAMGVKKNGALVTMSGALHVCGCSGQTTSYPCDPVPLAGHEVSYLHKNTDSMRNGPLPPPLL